MGYVWAVTVGIATFAVATMIVAFLTGAAQASVASLGLFQFLLLWCVFCIFYWTVGLLVAIPAVSLMLYGGERIGGHSGLYYGVTGALTGVYISPIYVAIDLPLYWVTSNNMSFWERCLAHLPWGILGCFTAGLTLWWKAGRALRQDAVSKGRIKP